MFGFGMAVPGVAVLGTPRRAENLLEDSWQLTTAYWGGNTPYVADAVGTPDPWGSATACVMYCQSALAAWATKAEQIGRVYATQAKICGSAYFLDDGDSDLNPYMSVRFVNGGTVYSQALAFTRPGGLVRSGVNFADGSGVIDVGGGWYRAYIVLDLAGRSLNAATIKFAVELFGGAADVNQSFYLAGLQVNTGDLPTAYSARP